MTTAINIEPNYSFKKKLEINQKHGSVISTLIGIWSMENKGLCGKLVNSCSQWTWYLHSNANENYEIKTFSSQETKVMLAMYSDNAFVIASASDR